ncbi:MAG: radical SAM family heme chaperone HemW [Anaeromyxobacteraceae bacterium]
MPFGVYVHFPYCASHCPYCDFAVEVEREIPQARYTRAVLDELALRGPAFAGGECRSLYLGGGTPSLWDPDAVATVIADVRRRFALAPSAEVTLEANPESADRGRLAAFRDAGVNRFSIGAQSFDPGVLVKLGRSHGPDDAERAIRTAAEVVENVAVDLIHGARRSSPEIARRDAERAAALPVTHVSAYALTVDASVLGVETPFARLARTARLPLPPDDDVVLQARAVRRALGRAGLRRYEISNYARPGFASVHNGLYWSSDSYLGVGAGAYGCLHSAGAARRWGNRRDARGWMADVEAGRAPAAEEEVLGHAELGEERLLLALRTRAGLPLEEVAPAKRGEVDALVRARLAVRAGGRLVLTSRGMDVHSAVVERLME